MRRSAILVLVAAAAVVPSAPAGAAPPEPSRSQFEVPAGAVCDFPLRVESSAKAKVIQRDDYTIAISAREVVTLTNAATGDEVLVRLNGTFRDRPTPDGGLVSVSTGRNLAASSDTGVVLLVGRFQLVFDGNGDLVGDIEGSGQQVDLCAAID